MSAVLDNLSPSERRGFARLFAEECAPYMEAAVAEFMGQNGEQHRRDHIDLQAFLLEMRADKKERKELIQKVKQQLVVWSIVSILGGVGYLVLHWLTRI